MKYKLTLVVISAVAALGLVWGAGNQPVAPPSPILVAPLTLQRLEYDQATHEAAQVLLANGCRDTYASQAGRAAVDAGIEANIVAGVIVVESSCQPLAESPAGAIGLMQINVHVWRVSRRQALDPETNIRIGTRILAAYIKPRGVRAGLVRYNGLGTDCTYCDAGYTTHVLYAANRR